jgi:hypothetical protein
MNDEVLISLGHATVLLAKQRLEGLDTRRTFTVEFSKTGAVQLTA